MPIIQLDNVLLLPLCNLVFLRQAVSIAHNTKGQNTRLQKKRVWKEENVGERDKIEIEIYLSNLHDPILILGFSDIERSETQEVLLYQNYIM